MAATGRQLGAGEGGRARPGRRARARRRALGPLPNQRRPRAARTTGLRDSSLRRLARTTASAVSATLAKEVSMLRFAWDAAENARALFARLVSDVRDLRGAAESINALLAARECTELSVIQVAGFHSYPRAEGGTLERAVALGQAVRLVPGGTVRLHFVPQVPLSYVAVEVVYGPALITEVCLGTRSLLGANGQVRRIETLDSVSPGMTLRVDVTRG